MNDGCNYNGLGPLLKIINFWKFIYKNQKGFKKVILYKINKYHLDIIKLLFKKYKMRVIKNKDIKKIVINQTKFVHVILQINGFPKKTPLGLPDLNKYVYLRDLNPGKKYIKLPIRNSPLTWIGMYHMIQCYYDYFFSFDLDIYFLKRFHAIKDNSEFQIDYGLNYFNYSNFLKTYSIFNFMYYFIYYDYMLRELYLIESKYGIFLKKSKFIISKEIELKDRAINFIYAMQNKDSLYSIKLRSFIAGYFDLIGRFNFIFKKDNNIKFGLSISIEFCAYIPLHALPVISLSYLMFEDYVEDLTHTLSPGDFDEIDVDEKFNKDYTRYMEVVNYNKIDENKIYKLKEYFKKYNKWSNKEWNNFLLKYSKPKIILDHFNYVHEVWWLSESNFQKDIFKNKYEIYDNLKNKKKIYINNNKVESKKEKIENFEEKKYFNKFFLKNTNKIKENKYVYKIEDKYKLLNEIIPFFKKYLLKFSTRFINFKYIEFILKEYKKNNNLNIVHFVNILEIIFSEIGSKNSYSFFELIDILIKNSTET